MGALGAQADLLRVPLADGTLIATPDIPSDDLVPSLLAASDVLGTGWFGAVAAEAGPGKTVAVVGDGAVGLLAVLAAKQLGAERIIAMSRHESRQRLAREFGATDIVEARGDEGVAAIKELTDGLGAHSVVEAVGTQQSMNQALHATRPGGDVGLRRRRARRRAGRHGPVLEPRARARRARPGAPLPARADRPHLEPPDRPRQGLRPHAAARRGRRGLPRHGPARSDQDAAGAMTEAAWTADELDRMGDAEELRIAPRRKDGTLRRAVPIWVVRVGDELHVRSLHGDSGGWYRAARATGEGHVSAGGISKEWSCWPPAARSTTPSMPRSATSTGATPATSSRCSRHRRARRRCGSCPVRRPARE